MNNKGIYTILYYYTISPTHINVIHGQCYVMMTFQFNVFFSCVYSSPKCPRPDCLEDLVDDSEEGADVSGHLYNLHTIYSSSMHRHGNFLHRVRNFTTKPPSHEYNQLTSHTYFVNNKCTCSFRTVCYCIFLSLYISTFPIALYVAR